MIAAICIFLCTRRVGLHKPLRGCGSSFLAEMGYPAGSSPMDCCRLHLTLQKLGQFEGGIPRAVMDLALDAGARMDDHEPFGVCLNRLQSRGWPTIGGRGCAELSGVGPHVRGLRGFQRQLGTAMRQAGFAEPQVLNHFTPHMTLDYGLGGVPRTPVPPLMWTAVEFALVESLYGRSQHNVLARWPLVARQQSFGGW